MEIYTVILQEHPNHSFAKKKLRKLKKKLLNNQSVQVQAENLSRNQVNALVKLYQSGQMVKTEQACRELLQTYPKSLFVLNVLGAALSGQGKLQGAVQAYNKAIQLKPDFADAYSNRGNALKDLGRLDEAVASYDKAIQLKPDYAEAHFNRGGTLQELGRYQLAMASCQKAVSINPVSYTHLKLPTNREV